MCNILKWFKSDCVDYTKPDKVVEVEINRKWMEAEVKIEPTPKPTWAHPPVYPNQWAYYYNQSLNNVCNTAGANLTIF